MTSASSWIWKLSFKAVQLNQGSFCTKPSSLPEFAFICWLEWQRCSGAAWLCYQAESRPAAPANAAQLHRQTSAGRTKKDPRPTYRNVSTYCSDEKIDHDMTLRQSVICVATVNLLKLFLDTGVPETLARSGPLKTAKCIKVQQQLRSLGSHC